MFFVFLEKRDIKLSKIKYLAMFLKDVGYGILTKLTIIFLYKKFIAIKFIFYSLYNIYSILGALDGYISKFIFIVIVELRYRF